MATVTYSNLVSESRNNILTLISSKTNVADPTTTSSEFRKWIYSREPDVKKDKFYGYPYIVLSSPDVDVAKEGGSLNGKSKEVTWTLDIDIVCSDRGYGNKEGKGLTYLEAISDDIFQTLYNKTNRNTLMAAGLYFANLTTSSVTTEIIADELVYRRTISAEFSSRMQVSA